MFAHQAIGLGQIVIRDPHPEMAGCVVTHVHRINEEPPDASASACHATLATRLARGLGVPGRHDGARRVDCGFLARLVAAHRLDETEAAEVAVDLAYNLPKRAYKLDAAASLPSRASA